MDCPSGITKGSDNDRSHNPTTIINLYTATSSPLMVHEILSLHDDIQRLLSGQYIKFVKNFYGNSTAGHDRSDTNLEAHVVCRTWLGRTLILGAEESLHG